MNLYDATWLQKETPRFFFIEGQVVGLAWFADLLNIHIDVFILGFGSCQHGESPNVRLLSCFLSFVGRLGRNLTNLEDLPVSRDNGESPPSGRKALGS